jgi:four helix bundle protein
MITHESLVAWQEAEAVSLAVLEISRNYWKPFARAVFDQLQRASVSVQTNIAEGYAYSNSPTLRNHLRISYGSAIESGDLLLLLSKADIVPGDRIQPVLKRCQRSQRLILGLMKRYGAMAESR